jgi:radical SAM protein with 4Fe4S-binding SPASM domain
MYSTNLNLGKGTTFQKTVDENVDQVRIELFLYEKINEIQNFLKNNPDKFGEKILVHLKSKKKIIFNLNKHEELFIINKKKNLDKIIKYLIFRYKFHLCERDKINLGYPPYLLIEPVSTCNLKCPFCFQLDKSFTRKPFMGAMMFELFKKIVDEANELGVGAVTLASRGEPTLHKKFSEMLEYLNEKKNIFEVKVNTNGTFLNDKICHSIFNNNLTQIVISADHYLKKDYERLRLGSDFEEVVKNVDMLFNIRKNYYPDSITEIRVSGVDIDKNLNRKKFKEFWIKRCDHVTAGYPLERWDTYSNKTNEHIKDPCAQLWDRMYVWFDGKVNPCDADYKSYLSYGNVNNQNIKKIWNDKIITKLRKDHLNQERNKIIPCDRCGVTFV